MKSLLSLGMIAFALTFCGLGERLKQLSGSTNSGTNSSGNSTRTSTVGEAEKPKLTAAQQTVSDGAVEMNWNDQGISWRLPPSWKKQDVKKESLLYSAPDNASLIASISVMNDDFPSDESIKATYDSALQQMKNGKYETVRYVEIDGIKGVEWTETMPEDKDGPRRHQWLGSRRYLGQNQQLNIMLATKGSNFEKHRDDFPAVMYSMKIAK